MRNLLLEKVALSLFIIAVVVAILILAKVVLIPLAISFFFTYLLYPVVNRIEKWGVHRGAAIFMVLFVALLLIGGTILGISVRLSNMTIDYADIKEQVDTKADMITDALEDKLGLNSNTIDNYTKKASSAITDSWENKMGSFFAATTNTLFQIGILPVFTFFLLFYRTKTAYFIFRLVGRKNKPVALRVLKDVSTVATQYLLGQLLVILVLTILNTAGLYIIGVPNGIVFGALAAVLNLIPYLGMFTGSMITILYVIFTISDPFNMALQVMLMYMGVQFLENNLITPNIVGNNIKINPFAIIFGILIANLIWGVAGMLLVIPFLAIFKIIMRNIDDLKPFAYLISEKGMENHKIKIAWWDNLVAKFKKS